MVLGIVSAAAKASAPQWGKLMSWLARGESWTAQSEDAREDGDIDYAGRPLRLLQAFARQYLDPQP
ncbi:hypothetical protein NOVOSPHI9U_30046 [Novosphingobium sp. 9U]|nr:hypothetical protein NOVOSPHI9U_30046 [Novosphingobium sp. 9U]